MFAASAARPQRSTLGPLAAHSATDRKERITMDYAILEEALRPWLGTEQFGDATRIRGIRAIDALAALEAAGVEDEEPFDGLPCPTRLCRVALELHIDAWVSGLLIGPPELRPDARLHLDCVLLPGRLLGRDLRPRVAQLFAPDEQPCSVTRNEGHVRVWELFWD
jgi:hypothetical protein